MGSKDPGKGKHKSKGTRRIVVPADLLAVMSPGEVTLGRRESHYVRHVLRMTVGDDVELMDGLGTSGHGHISALDDCGVRVELTEFGQASAMESPLKLTLIMGMPKGPRWDFIVQKTTELGIDRLLPAYTKHGEVRIPPEKTAARAHRWTRIATEAARQSGRSVAPEIDIPRPLDQLLELLSHEPDIDLKLMAWESLAGKPNRKLGEALLATGARPSHVILLVGPEGGFAPEEAALAAEHGFTAVSLGPRILRAETAAMAMTTLLQHILGDMG